MIILTLRTDKPEAEIGIYDDDKRLAYENWSAHRELAETIHHKMLEILNKLSISLEDVKGIVVYGGPGSFTGLRIGISVANALAYAQSIPVIASSGSGWIVDGVAKLQAGGDDKIVLPKYGSAPHVTKRTK